MSASTIMSNGNITLFAHWKIHTTISTTAGEFTGILDVPAGASNISVTMSDCSYACTDSAGHEGQVCYIYICSTSESLGDLGYYYDPWTGGTATADISGRSTVYVKTNWVHWQYHYNCKNEIHYITITFE